MDASGNVFSLAELAKLGRTQRVRVSDGLGGIEAGADALHDATNDEANLGAESLIAMELMEARGELLQAQRRLQIASLQQRSCQRKAERLAAVVGQLVKRAVDIHLPPGTVSESERQYAERRLFRACVGGAA